MPEIRKEIQTETYDETEVRIAEACKKAQKRDFVSLAHLARDFKVPYKRLQGHLRGAEPLSAFNRLTSSQEAAVIQWIRAQCAASRPPTTSEILKAANGIMKQAPRYGICRPLTRTWVRRFIEERLPSDMVWDYPKSSCGVEWRAEADFDASSGSNHSVKDADINHSGKPLQQRLSIKRGRLLKVVSIIDTSPAPKTSLVPEPSPALNPHPLKREEQLKAVAAVDTSPASTPSLVSDSLPISCPQASKPAASASPMPAYNGDRYISPLDDPKIRFGQDWRLMRQKCRENREIANRVRWDCDAMEEVLRTHRQLESPEPEDIKVDLFAGLRV